MNRKSRRMTARERREQVRKSNFIVRLVIAVVALVECLLLLTFTTYSWIESSSSLIIATGQGGAGKMINNGKYISLSVANNMNYQVLVASDSAGNATLTDNEYNLEEGDGGFYRSVRYFNYARTSSADGKSFYFPKRGTTHDDTSGYDIYNGTVSGYRAGDTADYNTTYTYVDFKLKNTTRANKSFYFDARTPVFTFTGTDADLSNNQKASVVIQNAMRISVQKNNGTADIYSLNGNSADAITSTASATQTVQSRNIVTGHYQYTGDAEVDIPVFESEYSDPDVDPEDSISVRIWFEMHDTVYAGLSDTDKATVDNILASPDSLQIDLAFINDNVDYGQLYFDDFAFSDLANKQGKFVTDETAGYGMYFCAFNSKLNKVVAYPMSVSVNDQNDAKRWMCSVPIPYVVQGLNNDGTVDHNKDYLTGSNPTKLNQAYFYYGTVKSDGTPDTEYYKWTLPGSLAVEKVNDRWRITDNTAYMRNLGVVRSAENQSTPIPGFIQFSNDSSGAMQLFYLKDHTTALTSLAYNTADASNWNKEFLKIRADSLINTGTEVTESFDATAIDGYENYYYADIPSGCLVIFATGTTSNIDYEQQTHGSGVLPNDGDIVRITGRENPDSSKTYLVKIVQDASLPKLNTPGYVRVYFDITEDHAASWPLGNGRALYVHYWGNASGTAKIDSISEIEDYTVVSDDARKPSNVYLNRKTAGNHETAATKTVSMYCYDNANGLFKAYIPTNWITDTGFVIHHNQLNGYYSLNSDKVRWETDSTSTSDTYTALGYTNATDLTNLSAGTGVGTWSDTRELSFSTELLNTSISSTNRYKVGFGSGSYAMIPTDDLRLKFSAWVPVDGLSSQSSNHNIAFTRYSGYTGSTATGTWIPHENITDEEETYYPVVLNGGQSGATVGWFHVAVLSDATYKNLIYATLSGVDGSSLAYSYDGTSYTTIASNSGGTLTSQSPYCLDNHHWVVPMKSGNTLYDHIYFKWIAYPAAAGSSATQFVYDQDISDETKYISVTE